MKTSTNNKKDISTIRKERQAILKNIETLKTFPNTKTVQQLLRELKDKLQAFEKRIERQIRLELNQTKQHSKENANVSRSNKLRKYHKYLRQIRNSYPNLKYTELRKMFRDRKAGKEVDIPDVLWQNPSP